jgi:hypothetical protein
MTGSNSFTRSQLAFELLLLNAQVDHTRLQPKRGQSLIKSSSPFAACSAIAFLQVVALLGRRSPK